MSPHTLRYVLRAVAAYAEPTPDGQDKFWIERELENAIDECAIQHLEEQVEDLESDLRSAERRCEDFEIETESMQFEIKQLEQQLRELQAEIDKHEDALLRV